MTNSKDEEECLGCSSSFEEVQELERKLMEKYGWIVHAVFDDPASPTGVNFHTHGLSETFDHADFQLVVPLSQDVAHSLFNILVNAIKEKKVFINGERYSKLLQDLDVTFFSTTECDRPVLRIILPDSHGNLDEGTFEDEGFDQQYVQMSSHWEPGNSERN